MQQKADFGQIKIVRPQLLKQPNDHECGSFVLHYLQKIFGSVNSFVKSDSWNSLDEKWFPIDEVHYVHVFIYIYIYIFQMIFLQQKY